MNSFSWSDWATSGIEIIYLTDCLFDRPAVGCKIRIQVWQVEMIFEPIEASVALKSPNLCLLLSQTNNNHN